MSAGLRLRYAPSPTGHLHIGGARTALFSYLVARGSGGSFVIRFEDTDQSRHVESGVADQLNGLKWLGVEWDESVDVGGPYAPYRQMERLPQYREYIEELLESGAAYRCYCTADEVEREREQQESRGETPKYSGKCRHISEADRQRYEQEGRIPSIRFAVPMGKQIEVDDRIRGKVSFETDGIGDFVIVRTDGIPTYNLAVVLDDHLMDIDVVIRGEEHLTNTPKQLMLYEAFGWKAPDFAHISLILNQDRKKMSKRDESIIQFIEQYRELGYLPEAVMNFIALLGWSPKGEQEMFGKDELIEQFTLEGASKSPAVFDPEKLNWMNNEYIKAADANRIADLAIPHLQHAGKLPHTLDESEREWVVSMVGLMKEKLHYIAEITDVAKLFFQEAPIDSEEAKAVLAEEQVPVVLRAFHDKVAEMVAFEPDEIKQAIKQVQKDTGCKGKQLFMPIRAALTGQIHGPDLNKSLSLLGAAKVKQRLADRLLS